MNVVIKVFTLGITFLYKIIDKATYWFLFIGYSVLVMVLVLQVFSRFIITLPFMWTEEVARYLFIWITYVAASVCIAKRRHIVVDFIVLRFPIKIRLALEIFYSVGILLFAAYVAWWGFQFSQLNFSRPFFSTSALNLGIAYLSVPVGLTLVILNLFRNIYRIITLGDDYYNKVGAE